MIQWTSIFYDGKTQEISKSWNFSQIKIHKQQKQFDMSRINDALYRQWAPQKTHRISIFYYAASNATQKFIAIEKQEYLECYDT